MNATNLAAIPRTGTAKGTRGPLTFHVVYRVSKAPRGQCATCEGRTLRSKYGILHADCYGCRYLKMIYGPNIKVTRKP